MKKLLPILLLIICLKGKAQDYIPFLSNSVWCEHVGGFFGADEIWIMPQGNETINGHDYVKYTDVPFFAPGNVYMREDIAARKVYRLFNNEEQLLYDFSLQINDQITMSNGAVLTVTNRDSIPSVTGRKRLRLRVTQQDSPPGFGISESWIEGVGTWNHPFRHSYEMPTDPSGNIKCSFTDSQPGYNSGLVNGGTPDVCALPTASVAQIPHGLHFY